MVLQVNFDKTFDRRRVDIQLDFVAASWNRDNQVGVFNALFGFIRLDFRIQTGSYSPL